MSVIDVTKDDFDDAVATGTVLVDVWAEHCAPCLKLTPHLEQFVGGRDDLTLAKLDATSARRLLMKMRVQGLPTLLLFRDGEEVARLTDSSLGHARAIAWLKEQLAAPARPDPANP